MDSAVPIALGSVIAFFSVPVLWIVTSHQRKVAEIIHRGQSNASDTNVLAGEMKELRQAVNQQTIAMDTLSSESARPYRSPLLGKRSAHVFQKIIS